VTASNAPVVTHVSPNRGGLFSLVLITGHNLTGATSVSFGNGHPAFFLTLSSSFIVALAPPQPRGTTVDVTVTTKNGTSATSAADRFTYR
jgi:hypothetical protein